MYKRLLAFLMVISAITATGFAVGDVDLSSSPALAPDIADFACIGDPIGGHDSGTITYEAGWRPHSWTVVYDGNGYTNGEEEPESHTCYYDDKDAQGNEFPCLAALQGSMAKTGSAFGGWTVSCSTRDSEPCEPAVSEIAPGGSLRNVTSEDKAIITLTAVWNACECSMENGAMDCIATAENDGTCSYRWSCENAYYAETQSASGQKTKYTARCNACPVGYNAGSDGNRTSITQCYSDSKTREWTGSQTACVNPDPVGCADFTCTECRSNSCEYVAYSNFDGTADGVIKSGCTENNISCQQAVESLTPNVGYYADGTENCPPNKYVVSYGCGDGGQGFAPKNGSVEYMGNYTLAGAKSGCERKGYSFDNWECRLGKYSETGAGRTTGDKMPFDAGYKIDPWEYTNNMHCEATWKLDSYTITYYGCVNGNCSGSDLIPLNDHVADGKKSYNINTRRLLLPGSGISVDGYDFVDTYASSGTYYNKGDYRWYVDTGMSLPKPYVTGEEDARDLVLYTKLKPYYRVTYSCGDGQGTAPTDETQYAFDKHVTVLSADNCRRTGYSFDNWECNGGDFAPGEKFNIQENTHCVAQWEQDTYTLTYDCNKIEDNIVVLVEDLVPGEGTELIDAAECENEGFDFNGWVCDGGERDEYDDNKLIMPDKDVTCTAAWVDVPYTIKYACDGVESDRVTEVVYGKEYELKKVLDVCATDIDWSESWDCEPNISASGLYNYAEDALCNAKPKELEEYSIKYYIDDEEVPPMAGNPSVYNVNTNVQLVKPDLGQGIEFYGWYLCDNKDEIEYVSGARYSGDLRICGNTERVYRITYYGCIKGTDCKGENKIALNNQIQNNGQKSYTVNTARVSLPRSGLSVNGYSFVDKYANSGRYYSKGDYIWYVDTSMRLPKVYVEGSDVRDWELYTALDLNSYVIKYVGGTAGTTPVTKVAMANQNVVYGQPVTLSKNTFAATGYEFVEWHCRPTVTDENSDDFYTYTDEDTINSYDNTSDIVCEAQWKPLRYNIVYVGCDGETVDDVSGVGGLVYDEMYSLADLNDLSEDVANTLLNGYQFDGWRKTLVGVVPDYYTDTEYGPWKAIKGLTLYAVCTPIDYHVSYNCDSVDDGSINPVDGNDYHIGDTVDLAANTCVKLGYTFQNWDCDSVEIVEDEEGKRKFVMPAADVTCVANWSQDEYSVTYDCNGADAGAVPVDSSQYTYGTFVGVLDNTCEKTGATFEKWSCEEESTGGFFIAGDTTCSVVWTPNKYDIVYVGCDGITTDEDSGKKAIVYGENTTYSVKDIKNTSVNSTLGTGYKSLYWVDENNERYEPGNYTGWTNTNGLTLYAMCVPEDYTITYQHSGGRFEDEDLPLRQYNVYTQDKKTYDSIRDDLYVFDGWYDNEELAGDKVTFVPGEELRSAPRDITLWAKWLDAGQITYDCKKAKFNSTKVEKWPRGTQIVAPTNDDLCNMKCDIARWHCDDGRDYTPGANMTIPYAAMNCDAVKSCGNVDYKITYIVYTVDTNGAMTQIDNVYVGDTLTAVSALTPKKYKTSVSVPYPVISLPGYSFEGWFENADFTGRVEGTPTRPDYEEGVNLTVYGKLTQHEVYHIYYHNDKEADGVSGVTYPNGTNPSTYNVATPMFTLKAPVREHYDFAGWYLDDKQEIDKLPGNLTGDLNLYARWDFVCNKGGKPHWLHLTNKDGSQDEKVCLYERPQGWPTIRMAGKNGENYYLMLSSDENVPVHAGSDKKMHMLLGPNGRTYNVCDRSSCP